MNKNIIIFLKRFKCSYSKVYTSLNPKFVKYFEQRIERFSWSKPRPTCWTGVTFDQFYDFQRLKLSFFILKFFFNPTLVFINFKKKNGNILLIVYTCVPENAYHTGSAFTKKMTYVVCYLLLMFAIFMFIQTFYKRHDMLGSLQHFSVRLCLALRKGIRLYSMTILRDLQTCSKQCVKDINLSAKAKLCDHHIYNQVVIYFTFLIIHNCKKLSRF